MVPDDAVRPTQTQLALEVYDGRELGTSDVLAGFHHPLQGLLVGHGASAKPHCGAVSQNTLDREAVKVHQDLGRLAGLLEASSKGTGAAAPF